MGRAWCTARQPLKTSGSITKTELYERIASFLSDYGQKRDGDDNDLAVNFAGTTISVNKCTAEKVKKTTVSGCQTDIPDLFGCRPGDRSARDAGSVSNKHRMFDHTTIQSYTRLVSFVFLNNIRSDLIFWIHSCIISLSVQNNLYLYVIKNKTFWTSPHSIYDGHGLCGFDFKLICTYHIYNFGILVLRM